MAQYDFNRALNLGNKFQDYAKELSDADRIRLAGFLLGLVNAVQQTATISPDAMWHARECTSLFIDPDGEDTIDPGYHLHSLLDDLAADFEELAEIVEADNDPEVLATKVDAARDAALAKLTDAEKILLGLPV